jgi:hypothetical protein
MTPRLTCEVRVCDPFADGSASVMIGSDIDEDIRGPELEMVGRVADQL